jgi:hypothetical protein
MIIKTIEHVTYTLGDIQIYNTHRCCKFKYLPIVIKTLEHVIYTYGDIQIYNTPQLL